MPQEPSNIKQDWTLYYWAKGNAVLKPQLPRQESVHFRP